eukprot:520429-Rhodomonas_salina.1
MEVPGGCGSCWAGGKRVQVHVCSYARGMRCPVLKPSGLVPGMRCPVLKRLVWYQMRCPELKSSSLIPDAMTGTEIAHFCTRAVVRPEMLQLWTIDAKGNLGERVAENMKSG